MNFEYIKDYRSKELRQYVVAYLLIFVSSIGLGTSYEGISSFADVLKLVSLDVLAGAMCVLVLIFNELWPTTAKIIMVYGKLPSDTIFSDIEEGKKKFTGFNMKKAQALYADYAKLSSTEQTEIWNTLLKNSKKFSEGNVIEAQRLQLMTRDICVSTVSLLIMSVLSFIVLAVVVKDCCFLCNILWFPFAYLVVMFFITRVAASNRAKRFVEMVIKNDIQSHESTSQ